MKQNRAFLRLPIRAILCLLVGFCISGVSTTHSQGPTKIPIYIKDREIWVEVARTDEERARGLMGRASLGKDEGMVFIFEKEAIHGFWMKNTLLPLSIAFIDKEGRIISITDMEPLTLSTHDPPRPVLYALEMNKGWFAKNGIKVGDIVRFSK
jgi:hypothetical protein